MKKLLFIFVLLGFEGTALADADPAPLSSQPIDWLLPILAYCLPGMLIAFLLNEFVPKIGLFWRFVLSVFLPALFWGTVLCILFQPDRGLIVFLAHLYGFLLFDAGLYILVPSGVVIVASGYVHYHRREMAKRATRFATL